MECWNSNKDDCTPTRSDWVYSIIIGAIFIGATLVGALWEIAKWVS